MNGDVVAGIMDKDFPGRKFKLIEIKKLLHQLLIGAEDTLAIGDSPADKLLFEFAGKSVAINPKNGIEQYVDFVIDNDLSEVIPIIEKLNRV